jgi:hypothetical protein
MATVDACSVACDGAGCPNEPDIEPDPCAEVTICDVLLQLPVGSTPAPVTGPVAGALAAAAAAAAAIGRSLRRRR